jgi:hypothetical protein
MLLLRCSKASRTTDDDRHPCTLLCTEVVRPEEKGEDGSAPGGFVTAGWWDLPEHYTVSGPLGLAWYPGGGEAALIVPHYSVGMILDGPVFFFLSIYDPAFDPSPFIGRVLTAEGRGGEPRRDLDFRWAPGPHGRVPDRAWQVSLEQLGLSGALVRSLEADSITTTAELCLRSGQELLELRDLGANGLLEVRERLAVFGLWLWGEEPVGEQKGAEPGPAPDPAA